MCVGTTRHHLRRITHRHYRHYPIMQIFLLNPSRYAHDGFIWVEDELEACAPVTHPPVELSGMRKQVFGWKSSFHDEQCWHRRPDLYLRPGLDPPASVDGGVLPAPLYRKKLRSKTKKKISKKIFFLVLGWKAKREI